MLDRIAGKGRQGPARGCAQTRAPSRGNDTCRGAPGKAQGPAREDRRRHAGRVGWVGGLRSVRREREGGAAEQRRDEQRGRRRERVRHVQQEGGRGDRARGKVGQRGRLVNFGVSWLVNAPASFVAARKLTE